MGHEDDGFSHFPLDPQELILEALPRDPVDRPKWLVHQQHGRVGPERPGDADSLPLPTRKLMRISARVLSRIQANQLEELGDAPLDPRLIPAEEPGHSGNVIGDAHVRKQSYVLDDVAHPQPQGHGVDVGDVLLVMEDAPAGRFDKPVDHLQRGRLATA